MGRKFLCSPAVGGGTARRRRGTMEGSDMLYGVTMQDEGISKLPALKTEETGVRLMADLPEVPFWKLPN
ncbi:MAG: hypothetical protein J1E06_04740 [Acutalibacter sp.]|nr:hypothetical protein [Acutalibacter sp.]